MKALYTAALCSSLLLGTLGHAQTTPGQTTPAPQTPGQAAPAQATPSPTTPGTSGTPSTTPAVSPTVLCGLAQEPGQATTSGQTTGGTAGTSTTPAPTGSGAGGTAGTTTTPGSSAGSAGSTSGTGTGTSAPGTTTPATGTGTGGTSGSGAAPAPATPGTSGGTSTGTAGNTGTPGSAAPPAGTSAPATGARLSATDTCFAEQAALGDQFEIQSSQLAAAQAANARVKAMATQIITDHTAATRQLSVLAPQLGLRLPTTLTGPKLTELAALRTSKGDAFDRAYVNAQVTAHEQAVNLFRAYGRSGGNAQLRAHATRTLPALERHLQAARDLLTALTR